jgi:hypothetical protein
LTDLTEYGDVMINAYMDEWGRRRIDGLLEDGTTIMVAEAPPPPSAAGILVQVM